MDLTQLKIIERKGAGVPTLLLHGFMGSTEDWNWLLEKSKRHFYLIDLFQFDCISTWEELELQLKDIVERCHIKQAIGYSMGGRIVWQLLEKWPGLFNKVVIESAHTGLKDEQEKSKRLIHDQNLLKEVTTEKEWILFIENWYQQKIFQGLSESPRFTLPTYQRLKLYRKAIDLYSLGRQKTVDFENYKCQTLFITGEQDHRYEKLARQITPHPFIEHRSFSECSHNCHTQNPQLFIDEINQFFR